MSPQTKCEQYWPEEGHEEYGPYQVTLRGSNTLAYYTLRTLTVRDTMDKVHGQDPSVQQQKVKVQHLDTFCPPGWSEESGTHSPPLPLHPVARHGRPRIHPACPVLHQSVLQGEDPGHGSGTGSLQVGGVCC